MAHVEPGSIPKANKIMYLRTCSFPFLDLKEPPRDHSFIMNLLIQDQRVSKPEKWVSHPTVNLRLLSCKSLTCKFETWCLWISKAQSSGCSGLLYSGFRFLVIPFLILGKTCNLSSPSDTIFLNALSEKKICQIKVHCGVEGGHQSNELILLNLSQETKMGPYHFRAEWSGRLESLPADLHTSPSSS